jgi:hypothetical protein
MYSTKRLASRGSGGACAAREFGGGKPTGQIVCYLNRTYRVLPTVVSIGVAFNLHFPDNQTMMAGAMVPRRMFQESLLLIAARRTTPAPA